MKTYLGDAVYADFDGYNIVLTTEYGLEPSNTIALEPSVLASLLAFRDSLNPASKAISELPETLALALDSAEAYSTASVAALKKGRAMLMAIPTTLPNDLEINAYGGAFWITVKRREDIQTLMQLAPRWSKSPRDDGIDYDATVDGVTFKLRAMDAALPPTCRVVEREVEVPAEPAKPARMVKRMMVECASVSETVSPETP